MAEAVVLPLGLPPGWDLHTLGELERAWCAAERYRATPSELGLIRAWLTYGLTAPCWKGPHSQHLRATIEGITTHQQLAGWMAELGEFCGGR